MNPKFLPWLIILLLLCTKAVSHGQPRISKSKLFLKKEIQHRHYMYAEVDMANPIAIWEEEFGLNKQLSYLFGIERNIRLQMDNYRPNDRKIRPAVILIHGGAFLPFDTWSRKDKSILTLAYELAQRGYSVFAIDYRKMNILAPSFIKGAYMAAQDAKAALRYIINHSKKLEIDHNKIFIGGISAGAITSLNAVFLDDEDDIVGQNHKLNNMFGCLDCVGEDLRKSYNIKGVINIAGGVYDVGQFMNNPDVSILSFHGENDDIVPISCGLPFEKLAAKYNSFMERMKQLCIGYPILIKELEEGKIRNICGSQEINHALKQSQRSSLFNQVKSADHYLVLSTNNTMTIEGQDILNSISEFLYELSL